MSCVGGAKEWSSCLVCGFTISHTKIDHEYANFKSSTFLFKNLNWLFNNTSRQGLYWPMKASTSAKYSNWMYNKDHQGKVDPLIMPQGNKIEYMFS